MKMDKIVMMAVICGMLTSISVFAVPLDITWDGTAPADDWGEGPFSENATVRDQFADVIGFTSLSPAVINLAGVNSINMTWNAPAGYMYVVNPPPADIGLLFLEFEINYGPDATSLGSITASSISVHTIYGNPSLSGENNLDTFPDPQVPNLTIGAYEEITPNTAPFAFSSITISLDFSQSGRPTMLEPSGGEYDPAYNAGLEGIPLLLNAEGQPVVSYNPPPDPGLLLTLEPLPTESTPDDCSTLTLAGLGVAVLFFFGRRLECKAAKTGARGGS